MALKYPLALVIRAVDRASGPLQQINARLEKSTSRLTAPFRRLGDRLTVLTRATGLPKVVDGFKGVGAAAGALSSQVLGIGATLAGLGLAGGAAFLGIVRSAQEAGGRLEDLSTVTGLSVNSFAELEFAAKRSGVENEAFAGGMEKLNKSISEARRGTGPLAALLSKVGPVYLKQLKRVKSNEEAFTLLAKAMGKIKDPGKRAELATAAFGKSGAGMVNVLKDGAAGVEALRAEYRAIVGDQTAFATNAGAFGDAIDNLELSFLGLRNTAAGALFPALTRLATAVTGFLSRNRDGLQRWAERTGAAIEKWVDGGGVERLAAGLQSLASTIGRVIDSLGGLEGIAKIAAVAIGVTMVNSAAQLTVSLVSLGVELGKFAARMGGLQLATWAAGWVKYLWMMRASILAGLIPSLTAATASMWSFTASLLANPITWAVGLLAGAAYLIYKNWKPISGFFKDLWQTIKFYTSEAWKFISETASAVWNAVAEDLMSVWTPVKTFFVDLWDGIVGAFKTAWEWISPIIDGVMFLQRLNLQNIVGDADIGAFGVRPTEFGAGAALGAAAALPQGQPGAGGDARVTVDFTGLPRGARVTPARENTAPLELNLGYSMVGP